MSRAEWRKALLVLGIAFSVVLVIGIASTVVGVATRFQYPQLTQTQLFLKDWKLYTCKAVSIFALLGLAGYYVWLDAKLTRSRRGK
jgi:uncharacterized BrkB/YihY/UPF0761 family membrane protein